MKKIFLVGAVTFGAVLFLLGTLIWLQPKASPSTNFRKLNIGGTEIEVEVADEPEERQQGLSNRASLPQDSGMLFMFDHPERYSFWMKDMRLALDIVWINSQWKVIDITHDAQPESYPQSFQPKEPAQYVLEINSGFARRNQLKIGDQAQLR